MPLKPIGTQILVQQVPTSNFYSSPILDLKVPDQYVKKSNQGVVKAIGPDVTTIEVGWYTGFEDSRGLVIEDKHGRYQIIDEADFEFRIEIEDEIIPGLFLESESGSFFPAPYEAVFSCVMAHLASKRRPIDSVKEIR
mgnify:CR=1 FL=1